MDGKYASTCIRLQIWPRMLPVVLLVVFARLEPVQARSIVPTLTILSSTIPTSRFQTITSSIFLSSDRISSTRITRGTGATPAIAQQLCDDEALSGIEVDIDTTNDVEKDNLSSIYVNDDYDDDDDVRNGQSQNALLYKEQSEPLVSIVTTTTANSIINDSALTLRLSNRSTNDTATIVHSVETLSKQHAMSTATANAIFVYSLATITGFGEICCLKSYGCFINMVTGSSVRLFMGIAEGQFRAIRLPICVTIGYVSGIIFARILKNYIDSSESPINGNMNGIDQLQQRQLQRQQKSRKISKSRYKFKKFLQSVTNVTRQKGNTSARLLWSATPFILVLFSATEIINALLQVTLTRSIVRLPLLCHVLLQAIGYGLVAQVMADVQAIPANVYVLTGHYVSVTKSFIDQYLHGYKKRKNDKSSTNIQTELQQLLSFVPTAQQQQSMHIVFFFGIGTMISSLMYKYVASLLPYQHTLTGVLYALTFFWYSLQLNSIAPLPN